MGIEITRFLYCDWHTIRGDTKAVEAMEAPGDPGDVLPPPGWAKIIIEQTAVDAEMARQVAAARKANPDAFAALSTEENTPLVIEEDVLALSPRVVPLLALLGWGPHADRVSAAIAAQIATPRLPSAKDLAPALADALPDYGVSPEDAERAMGILLDLLRSTIPPYSASDIDTILIRACRGPAKETVQ